MTGDVSGISAQRSNIVLDGNGYTLPCIVSSIDSLGNNVTANNAGGVYLKNVGNVMVKNLTIKDCQMGIYLERCSNVTVSGNTITGTHVPVPELQTTAGIFVWAGNSNIITENELANNYKGSYVGYGSQAQQNVITGNNIENNAHGIIMASANNNIYQNNFINNTIQVYLNGDIVNVWDHDKKGNFWSDYNGNDSNRDGIGDTLHVIDENNQDNYPLMASYKEPEPQTEPFPTTLVIAPIAAVAVIGVGRLVYFKKRKRIGIEHE